MSLLEQVEREIEMTKERLAALEQIRAGARRLAELGTSPRLRQDGAESQAPAREPRTRRALGEDNDKSLLRAMEEGGVMSRAEIIRASGLSPSSFEKSRARLVEQGLIVMEERPTALGSRRIYRLPDDASQAEADEAAAPIHAETDGAVRAEIADVNANGTGTLEGRMLQQLQIGRLTSLQLAHMFDEEREEVLRVLEKLIDEGEVRRSGQDTYRVVI